MTTLRAFREVALPAPTFVRAEAARASNEVVTGWRSIEKAALARGEAQQELFA